MLHKHDTFRWFESSGFELFRKVGYFGLWGALHLLQSILWSSFFFVEQLKRKQNDASSCDVECLMIGVSELQAQSEALNISEGLISQRTTWRRCWVMFVWVETSPLHFLLFHCAQSSIHIANTFRPDQASITPTLSLHLFSTNLASPWTSQELDSTDFRASQWDWTSIYISSRSFKSPEVCQTCSLNKSEVSPHPCRLGLSLPDTQRCSL